MHIQKILIENYRCFEHLEMDFEPGVNLIIGDNGSGKTSIMEALAVGLGGLTYHMNGAGSVNIRNHDIRSDYVKLGSAVYERRPYTPSSISLTAELDGEVHSWQRTRNSAQARSATGMQGQSIREWVRKLEAAPASVRPLFLYRKANKLTVTDAHGNISVSRGGMDRTNGYKGALTGELFDVYGWILQMQMLRMSGEEPREYQLFLEMVETMIQRMNESEERPVVFFDPAMMTFLYTEQGKTTTIDTVSDGYYWVLWMLMDLAARLLVLNPNLSSLERAEGIVLIDEIDLHLHPKWQWNILKVLSETFPKIQFIVTTHAPIVISSCRDANIIRIDDKKEADYPGSAYAYSVADVIELTQGSDAVLPEIKRAFYAFEVAWDAGNYEEAERCCQALEADFANSTEARKARMKLSFLNKRR